jgi:very-short-patch-repair endonuclease
MRTFRHPDPTEGHVGVDSSVARIAGARRGVITRAELLALGLSPGTIGRWAQRGRLHRRFPGVYAVGHAALDAVGEAHAALLAVGEGAVLGHQSAAWLLGLMPSPAVHHVTTTKRSGRNLTGVVVHRVRSLPPSHVTSRTALPVTTTARTLLDLAQHTDHPTLQRALNEADYRRQVTEDQLEAVLAETRGHRGAANLRIAIRDQAPAKSHLEDRFFAMLRAAALPMPEVNARVLGIEVDFLWRDRRLVETDGWAAHGTARRKRRDARRDERLERGGWTVLRVTRVEVERRQYAVLARLAVSLSQ